MPIRRSSVVSSGDKGFAIDTGDGIYTDVVLPKAYPAGGYQVVSANANQNLFIFFGGTDGSPAGGTAGKSIISIKDFDRLTIIGAGPNDLITFTYKETSTLDAVGTSGSYSGAVITSFSPNTVPDVDDTIIINGAAFSENVIVKFTGKNGTNLFAKSISRISESQLIVTRPDSMPGDQDPYRITVQNPGIEPAVSSNILVSPLYAGQAPQWSTNENLPAFTKSIEYSQELLATDPDGTLISYSFVDGSLPVGLTYSPYTSTISGIPSASTSVSFTIRATEESGRYTDRLFMLPDAYPVFVTQPTLPIYTKSVSYSTVIVASDDSGVSPSLSVVGTMPGGLSFNALTGEVSGTPTTSTNLNFTIRATDANGSTTDQIFTIPNIGPTWVTPIGTLGTFSGNSPFSATLSGTDDGTVAYSISSGSLPTGLSLNTDTGVISGTPSSSVDASFTVRLTDNAGNYVDRDFTMQNAAPIWNTLSALQTYTSIATSIQLGTYDDSTVTYSIVSGSLASGLSLSSSGVISGTATANGTFNFTVRATDTNSRYSDRSFSLSVGQIDQAFSYTGSSQTYTVPVTGTYSFKVWGAQGGISPSYATTSAGYGGYAYGTKRFTAGSTVYVYVGGQGLNSQQQPTNSLRGGFNGGGYGNNTGGGGATDFRTTTSLSDRFIVAGGGGGGYDGNGSGAGGGTSGTNGWTNNGENAGKGASQSAGGAEGGSFGQGGSNTYGYTGSGGGGGWYGGGSNNNVVCNASGGGGSGYIGGVSDGTMSNGVRIGNGYAEIGIVSLG